MFKTRLLILLSKGLSLSILVLTIAGCGFRPSYAPTQNSAENVWGAFAAIDILPISGGRSGQILRNELRTLLQPNGRQKTPKYLLNIVLFESAENLSVKKSAFATRANLQIRSQFVLLDAKTKKTLFSSQSEIISGFNIFTEEYATLAAEKNARKQSLIELAYEIRTRLSAVLMRKPFTNVSVKTLENQ
ncbi:MAG: hypothetical protein CFH06_00006 [Alphaproteobacteria bacterium MarineAlpha3_Bin5]|nr:hypothetical protein [Magnetovibrio sp.]PPR80185.1 MAG: hypothetical protein CFH06_00006 [Alphaproteobacteria bacterium MarineAlpha3_Bin5]